MCVFITTLLLYLLLKLIEIDLLNQNKAYKYFFLLPQIRIEYALLDVTVKVAKISNNSRPP